MSVLARVGTAVMTITGGLVPFRLIQRFGPERRIPLIEYLFAALHWLAFFGFVAVSVYVDVPSYFRSGDAGGLLFAAAALSLFPLKIGKVRLIGCLVLAILSGLIFLMSPSADALMTTGICALPIHIDRLCRDGRPRSNAP